MKKFTKISLILCAILAGAGLLSCIVGIGLGFGFGQIGEMVENGVFSFAWSDMGFQWRGGHEAEDGADDPAGGWTQLQENWEGAEVQNLDIEFRWGTLMIEPSNTSQIEAEASYRQEGKDYERSLRLKLEGDTLKVEDEFSRKNPWLLRPQGEDARLTLRIPAEMTFEDVKLDVDAATVELFTALDCQELEMKIGAGVFSDSGEATAVRAEEMKLEVGAGTMSVSRVWARKLEAVCGVGQMELGEVTASDTTVDCGVGEIFMAMTGRQEDYDYEVGTGVGSVSVGESQYDGLGTRKKVDNGGTNFIKIDCGVGSIDISFAE